MTWPALAIGLVGLLWILLRWRRAGFQDRLLAAYALLFYFVPEISPLKPAPDFARYVLPIVPALIYLGWRSVDEAGRSIGPLGRGLVAVAATIALVIVPFYHSVCLTSSMADDTRGKAAEWLQRHGGKALIEQYAGLRPNTWSAAEVDVPRARSEGVEYIVTSSFMYGRYFLGSQLRNQDDEIYRNHQRYVDLFKYPYVEISPVYRTFGFTNPLIRIVDIRMPKRPGPSEAK